MKFCAHHNSDCFVVVVNNLLCMSVFYKMYIHYYLSSLVWVIGEKRLHP